MPTSKYKIQFEPQALKQLAKLEINQKQRILYAIELLGANPRPPKHTKIKGFPLWRIRVGDYRVLYSIEDDTVLVVIVEIGHRRNVYNKLKNS